MAGLLGALKLFSHIGDLGEVETGGPPSNVFFYVPEDGTDFYVAEDGVSNYVTENSP